MTDVTTVPESTDLRPVGVDSSLVNSVGLHHSLPTAIADLVDNSLDAGASVIRVRLLLEGPAPMGVQVIDNGCGMNDVAVDRAMTYAGTREYSASDLGHFGVGLKAASLSQASTVLIYSRAAECAPVARKLVRSPDGRSPQVGSMDGREAAARLDAALDDQRLDSGTIVEWRDVRTFPSTVDDGERTRWVSGALGDIRDHLGLVFHRILAGDDEGPEEAEAIADKPVDATRTVSIGIDTFDISMRSAGVVRDIDPIDPFNYRRTGADGFPDDLQIAMPDGSTPVLAVAHVWPSGYQGPDYKIVGDPGADHQGFFVYRRDRLIQIGGWCGLWAPRPDWGLARVELDLTEAADRHVTINPEKSGLELSADLRRALESAVCAHNRLTFAQYLQRAAGEDRLSRTRRKHPVAVTEPVGGLPASVIDGYRDAVEMRPEAGIVEIRWAILPTDKVFHVDLENRQLQLNLHYRDSLVGYHSLHPDDAPIIKTLLHLLTEQYFAGVQLGQRAKREIAAWNHVILVAVRAQMATQASQDAFGRHSRETED